LLSNSALGPDWAAAIRTIRFPATIKPKALLRTRVMLAKARAKRQAFGKGLIENR
jgi:hypothetical protein